MKTLGILVNQAKPQASALLPRLSTLAGTLGCTLVSCQPLENQDLKITCLDRDRFADEIDALITLGGDGTLLLAVGLAGGRDIPVLDINLGRLGFLTGATEAELETAVRALVSGNFSVSKRSMLDVRILAPDGTERKTMLALNDVVVGWGQSTRIVALDVSIDGEPVTSYRCDGIIVSTPTGSTGHSLSAGGPILHPGAASLVLNVICPHTLSARPLVVPDHVQVRILVKQSGKKLLLSTDGRDVDSLTDGDTLVISKASHQFHLVMLPGYSYFSVLRQKLQWSGSSA